MIMHVSFLDFEDALDFEDLWTLRIYQIFNDVLVIEEKYAVVKDLARVGLDESCENTNGLIKS